MGRPLFLSRPPALVAGVALMLCAPPAGAAEPSPAEGGEDAGEGEDGLELTFVVGVVGGTGFEGHVERGTFDVYLASSGSLDPSPGVRAYAELWFHEWFGAGVVVDASWIKDYGCGFCAQHPWGAFGVQGATGTLITENVGFALRASVGLTLAEGDPYERFQPGFFFGANGDFRWYALPYTAVVIGVGFIRQSVNEVLVTGSGEATREVWLVEGRAHFGLELVL